ncbi:MAG: hypothetical protein ACO3RX_07955 [Chthoniobacterales bacterium]|jgi:hypothetical protein
MPAHDTDPPKEEFLVHDIPPQLEQELARRARENGRDLSAEAADIIEKHVEEEGGDTA